LARQSGSHKIYKDLNNNRVTVPFHDNKILHPKLLKSILKDANLNIDEINNLL
jgi:predicted RNA binding protein YcfA (HicA-like mRNA interferase family)